MENQETQKTAGEAPLPSLAGSALRRDQYETLRRHALLAEHTEARAKAIADHYTAYAQLAMELRKLIELRERMGPSEDADKAIEMITDEIKAGHAKDLGIELLWQNNIIRGTNEKTKSP